MREKNGLALWQMRATGMHEYRAGRHLASETPLLWMYSTRSVGCTYWFISSSVTRSSALPTGLRTCNVRVEGRGFRQAWELLCVLFSGRGIRDGDDHTVALPPDNANLQT